MPPALFFNYESRKRLRLGCSRAAALFRTLAARAAVAVGGERERGGGGKAFAGNLRGFAHCVLCPVFSFIYVPLRIMRFICFFRGKLCPTLAPRGAIVN